MCGGQEVFDLFDIYIRKCQNELFMSLLFTNNFCSLKMDLNSLRLCRLCLKTSDDLVNIFDNFGSTIIASVLSKHFWFQVNENDGLPECVCEICWTQTKIFHDFYKEVESAHREHSFNFCGADLTEQKRIGTSGCETSELSQQGATSKPDLTVITLEIAESPAEMNGLLINKEENCDFNDDYGSEQSNMQISYQDQSVSKKRKKKKIGDKKAARNTVSPPDIECSSSEQDDFVDEPQESNLESTNQSKREEENALIREFVNMECEICRDPVVQFETFRNVRQHYRKVHEIRGYVTCCGKKFHRRFHLLDHIRRHVDPDAYRCGVCGKRCLDKRILKAHMKYMHTGKSSECKCKICGKTFKTSGTLAYHERSKHVPENEKKDLQCEKCDKKFSTDETLRAHIRNVHESKSQICDICAQTFKTKLALRNHCISFHSATPLPKVQCNVCGAWLKSENVLKVHVKHQHNENARSICPICKKVVKNKRLLFGHMQWVHRSQKSHQCTMCDKAFKTSKNLKEHIATHTGEDLYSCEYCDKKFKSNGNRYAHRKAAHFAEYSRDYPERISRKKISKKSE